MGVDLDLLPFGDELGTPDFSKTVLDVGRFSKLFEEIEKLPTEPIPANFESYVSRDNDKKYQVSHWGPTKENGYGAPMMCTTARDLLTLARNEHVRFNPKNRAVWGYLRNLPRNTKIALYWH